MEAWHPVEVHFGHSIVNICRGMGAAHMGRLFQRDSICIRGYDLPSGGGT